MKQVTIRFEGRTCTGKTRLHGLFMQVLRSRGFKIVDWDIETPEGDYIVVDTSDTLALLEGTKIEDKEAAG